MIVQSHAIVLRCTLFQETSLVVNLFTRNNGVTGVLAKGARSRKSTFAGVLEPGNLLDVVYHEKQGRSLQLLKEASRLAGTSAGQFHPDRYSARIALVDLAIRLLQEHQPMPDFFDLMQRMLVWIDKTEAVPRDLFPYIMLRIAENLGVGIRFTENGTSLAGTSVLQVESGCISPPGLAQGMQLSAAMTRYMEMALSGNQKSLLSTPLDSSACRQLVFIMDRYLSYHFDGSAPRTAEILFDSYIAP